MYHKIMFCMLAGLVTCAPVPQKKIHSIPHRDTDDSDFPVKMVAWGVDGARVLFRKGNALRKAGDYQGALDYYERSRSLVASASNTINVAVCLEKLGRNSEALDVYKVLRTEFWSKLNEQERQFVTKKIGTISIFGNRESSPASSSRRIRVFD